MVDLHKSSIRFVHTALRYRHPVHSYRLLGQSASLNAASLSDMAYNSAPLYLVPQA